MKRTVLSTRSPQWALGWAAGAGIVAIAAGPLVTLIGLARSIAGQADEISSGLGRTAAATEGLWKVDALNATFAADRGGGARSCCEGRRQGPAVNGARIGAISGLALGLGFAGTVAALLARVNGAATEIGRYADDIAVATNAIADNLAGTPDGLARTGELAGRVLAMVAEEASG